MRTVDPNPPVSIRDLLKKLFSDLGFSFEPVGVELRKAWQRAVGPLIASHSMPYSFKRGTLTVLCPTPHWILELRMLKEQILEKLNAELGDQKVKRLSFKLGHLEPPKEESPSGVSSEISKEEAEALTASIKDRELKERILRILEAIRAKTGNPSL